MPSKQDKEARAILDAADALAAFANLEPANVQAFRRRFPDFLPPTFWTGLAWNADAGVYEPWIRERDLLRRAWLKQFPADLCLRLVASSLFLAANVLTSEDEQELASATQKVWPYQKSILFLQSNPWRAKVCKECGKRFVADHAKRKYCSIAGEGGSKCSDVVIERRHLEWGRQNNWGRKTTNR